MTRVTWFLGKVSTVKIGSGEGPRTLDGLTYENLQLRTRCVQKLETQILQPRSAIHCSREIMFNLSCRLHCLTWVTSGLLIMELNSAEYGTLMRFGIVVDTYRICREMKGHLFENWRNDAESLRTVWNQVPHGQAHTSCTGTYLMYRHSRYYSIQHP